MSDGTGMNGTDGGSAGAAGENGESGGRAGFGYGLGWRGWNDDFRGHAAGDIDRNRRMRAIQQHLRRVENGPYGAETPETREDDDIIEELRAKLLEWGIVTSAEDVGRRLEGMRAAREKNSGSDAEPEKSGEVENRPNTSEDRIRAEAPSDSVKHFVFTFLTERIQSLLDRFKP